MRRRGLLLQCWWSAFWFLSIAARTRGTSTGENLTSLTMTTTTATAYQHEKEEAAELFYPRGSSRTSKASTVNRELQRRCDIWPRVSCAPTLAPASMPTRYPSSTAEPTVTYRPTSSPTHRPTPQPTVSPSRSPTPQPTSAPTARPSPSPTSLPSPSPTSQPTQRPTSLPTPLPTIAPTRTLQPTRNTASPTVQPTSSPTAVPTQSPTNQPTTFSPTLTPTQFPTFTPTVRRTSPPTQRPTLAPTSAPTLAPTPEPSSAQPTASPTTMTPSQSPSNAPTLAPSTMAPTTSQAPSDSPTISFAPTTDPFGVDVTIGLDDDDNRAMTVTCRPELPDDALDVTRQLIQYDYILNVRNGTIVSVLLPEIEQSISDHLSALFMDCQFGMVRDFYVYQLMSSPLDRIASGCLLEEQVPGATCYSITGQLMTGFFYKDHNDDSSTRQRRQQDRQSNQNGGRLLQAQEETQIDDENVADAFASALDDFFSEASFGGASVVGASFSGVTNRVPPPPPEPENNTPQIVGGVFGALAGVVLIGFGVAYVLKRRNQEATNQYYQEAMDAVDSEIDDMETLAPGLQPRSVTIVNDDDDDGVEATMPNYSSASARDRRSRAVEFIGTATGDVDGGDTAPPTDVQRERMLKDTKRELGPTAYEPKITRGYGVNDTVDL